MLEYDQKTVFMRLLWPRFSQNSYLAFWCYLGLPCSEIKKELLHTEKNGLTTKHVKGAHVGINSLQVNAILSPGNYKGFRQVVMI